MQKVIKTNLHFFWTRNPFLFYRKIINTIGWSTNFQCLFTSKEKIRQKDAYIWKEEKNFKTDFYEKIDKDEKNFIEEVLTHANPTDRVLDICCNQGRFLLELRRKGFKKLYGFDIMKSAIEKLRTQPDFDGSFKIEQCLAQEYFSKQKDGSFDWAITYGATVELIHPEFDIFKELSRTVKKGLIFSIDENGHKYPRFYRYLIKKNKFLIHKISLNKRKSLIVAKK